MPLVAHLRGNIVFARQLRKHPCLIHLVRQRFLAVHVFTHSQCHGRSHRVRVVGRGDSHCVNMLALLFQHLAKIMITVCLGEPLETGGRTHVIHISHGQNVFTRAAVNIHRTLAARTDGRHVEPFIGPKHPAG